jgi:glycerate 2-kinase
MRLNGAPLLVEALEAALEAADPYRAVLRHVKRVGNEVEVAGRRYELSGAVHVVGFGKASLKIAQAMVDALGDDVVRGGVVISPVGGGRVGPVEVLRGDHPIPGEDTLRASQRLLQYLESVGPEDFLFVLISGGGSALFEVPEDEVSLRDVAWLTSELMKRGADIVELNAVRKRLSRVKGGKLLRLVKTRRVVSLIMSDVVGDRLDTIASGPTAPDETTRDYAVAVLQKYGLFAELPPHLRAVVLRDDTVKPGDPDLEKVQNVVVASNIQSLLAAAQVLAARGLHVAILTAALEGEAREAGRVLASVAKSAAWFGHPAKPPAALLAGGETVVQVRGQGVGGRNQELCLSFALAVRGLPVSAACMGTDGVDGISPAAGAVVDGYTAEEAERAGLNPLEHLDNNDSYTLFHKLGRAIYTGHTGTNVNDVFIALVYKT